MTGCVLHGAIASAQAWYCNVVVAVFDFQTLIAGVLAIGAAWYAARPVWRQLADSNLQTRIQHRETLASLLREAQDRYARVSKSVAEPLADLNWLTTDPAGYPKAIGAEDAFVIEQRLRGELDWYLVGLRATEAEPIEVAKTALRAAMGELVSTLNDVHWVAHHDQHDEDRSIPDTEWDAIKERSKAAVLLAADKAAVVEKAFQGLEVAQRHWTADLRARIARLDLAIASTG